MADRLETCEGIGLGCDLVKDCVLKIPLRAEVIYSWNEPQYGLKNNHLRNTLNRLHPTKNEFGVRCVRQTKLGYWRTVGTLVLWYIETFHGRDRGDLTGGSRQAH